MSSNDRTYRRWVHPRAQQDVDPGVSAVAPSPEVGRRWVVSRRLFLTLVPASYLTVRAASAADASTPPASLRIVAHEDDDLLFLSPDLLHSIQAGGLLQTIYVTAGDAGLAAGYWESRQAGMQAAYASMAGVANSWTQTDAGISGHPMPLFTLDGQSNISQIFMHLPDGNTDGSGFASTGNVSLQDLWTGTISSIEAVDGSSSYTRSSLISTLTTLITNFQPGELCCQDYVGQYGDGDHSDHYSVAYLTQSAQRSYVSSHIFTGYMDYPDDTLAANVSGADLTNKQNAFFVYAQYDGYVCGSNSACAGGNYALWLARQYTVAQGYPPIANAGPNQTVSVSATVQLDGSGSTAPTGDQLSYQWSQTAGTQVSLSSSTVVSPTFIAPATAATLTFQLVVTDDTVASDPSTVTITVGSVGNQPPVADAGADQTVAVSSTVQLDGAGSSDPAGNQLSYQWTQTGGYAQVTLSSATAVRPSFTAPANLDGLAFQLVVTDQTTGISSSPATVCVMVAATAGAGPDLALAATATASSQNAGTDQTAAKAIDGAVGGYPGNSSEEWATNGGGAGSWLELTWSSQQTFDTIVLYDRPNGADQITGGNIKFSDGSSITVGSLPASDAPYPLTFAAKTVTSLQLNITSVSASTSNVGLAEIQVYLS